MRAVRKREAKMLHEDGIMTFTFDDMLRFAGEGLGAARASTLCKSGRSTTISYFGGVLRPVLGDHQYAALREAARILLLRRQGRTITINVPSKIMTVCSATTTRCSMRWFIRSYSSAANIPATTARNGGVRSCAYTRRSPAPRSGRAVQRRCVKLAR